MLVTVSPSTILVIAVEGTIFKVQRSPKGWTLELKFHFLFIDDNLFSVGQVVFSHYSLVALFFVLKLH